MGGGDGGVGLSGPRISVGISITGGGDGGGLIVGSSAPVRAGMSTGGVDCGGLTVGLYVE